MPTPPINTRTWVRETIGPLVLTSFPEGRMYSLGTSNAPTSQSVLLRSRAELEMQVLVGANTGVLPTGGWWATSYTEFRLTWEQANPTSGPPLNDNSLRMVSRRLMTTHFEGSVGTPPIYTIRFNAEPLDTPVMRKMPAPGSPQVRLWGYHTDSVSALAGAYDTVITWSGWVDCLWGDRL